MPSGFLRLALALLCEALGAAAVSPRMSATSPMVAERGSLAPKSSWWCASETDQVMSLFIF